MTRIITNLPFGKQVGSPEALDSLYAALLQEFDSVLSAQGLMATLMSADQLWEQMLRRHDWRVVKKIILVMLGLPASIFVTQKA